MLTVQITYCVLYYTAFQNDFKKFHLIMGVVNDNHQWMLMVRLNIQSWPKISAPLVNMIKEGCEN